MVEEEVLKQEMLKLTDWYTDDLFYLEGEVQVVAPFSRIFCDPERFTDDALEPMAKFGMGVLYATTDEGQIMRELSNELRDTIKDNRIVENALKHQAVDLNFSKFELDKLRTTNDVQKTLQDIIESKQSIV